MGRYLGPSCRLCRREGVKLFLKGDRCFSTKCAIERRAYAPGQHGKIRKKLSPYALRLREKQKLRRIYGLMESQFAHLFDQAERRKGMTGENLLSLLERRLDNVMFRLGWASSRDQGRQLVTHGHVRINGKQVDIPSYVVHLGDRIELDESIRDSAQVQANIESSKAKRAPSWLQVDLGKIEAQIVTIPKLQEIDTIVNPQLVVEFYSR